MYLYFISILLITNFALLLNRSERVENRTADVTWNTFKAVISFPFHILPIIFTNALVTARYLRTRELTATDCIANFPAADIAEAS